MCDPLCTGCIYSIATPLLFKDCEKCKSLLKECPNKPGYYYFNTEEPKDNQFQKRNGFLSMTDKEVKVSILKEARARIEHTANECETRKRYGDESAPVLWHSKGIRDACWTIDDFIEEIERKT